MKPQIRLIVMLLATISPPLAVICVPQGKPSKPTEVKPPALTAEQREQIRKFQLDGQRLDSAIKQRQLEIIQAQQQAQANAQKFQAFVSGICGDKFEFDMTSDELRCIAKPVPTPTPTPSMTSAPTPPRK